MQFGIEFEYALGSPLSFHRWRHNKTITASGAFISCAEKCAFLIPSIPLDSMNTSSVIIDDTDTQIQYSPGWQQGGSTNEYKGTTTNAETKGAFFELKFIGTSITVYGTLALHSSSNSTYTVDGGEPFPFRSKGDNLVHYQKIFYTSPPLPYMEHTLVGNCTDDGAPVILDYFLIETPLNFLTNTTSPPPSICESKPAPPTAIIIGSVLGGFALLATIFASYLWYRGRNPNLMGISTRSSITHTPPLHATNSRTTIFTPNRSTRNSAAPLSAINKRNSSQSNDSQDVLLFCLEPGQTEPQRHNYKNHPRLWLNTGI
ncbi:hypothetical protein AB1N83_004078 [Pleurotus pulmonarius]